MIEVAYTMSHVHPSSGNADIKGGYAEGSMICACRLLSGTQENILWTVAKAERCHVVFTGFSCFASWLP